MTQPARPRQPRAYTLTHKGKVAAHNDGLIDARPLLTLADKGQTAAQEKETGK